MNVVPAGPAIALPDGEGVVISYCFPPYADTAAVVAAKRVREFGRPVRVVSNAMDKIRKQDASLQKIAGGLVRELSIQKTPTAFSSWPSISTFTAAAVEQVERWSADGHTPTWMYSRAQFTASNIAAAMVKRAHPDVFWVAEFSDPLAHDVKGGKRSAPVDLESDLARELLHTFEDRGIHVDDPGNVYEVCESLTYALADVVIFTNTAQRDYMASTCADGGLRDALPSKAVVIPHPRPPRQLFDLATPEYELDPRKINVGYFGNFYANRGLGEVLGALETVPTDVRDALRVHVFTPKVEEFRTVVARHSLDGVVFGNEPLPYLEFLALADRMDILYVNDATTALGTDLPANPFLPSKVSDYLGSSAQVWAAVEEGSPMSKLDLSYVSPANHLTATMLMLTNLARDRVH